MDLSLRIVRHIVFGLILELEVAGEKEVDEAVAAARAAFNGPWSDYSVVGT
jgi:acyl-CoA reductase-like NAD-dependent aldehyde dehydrogenase